MSLLDFDDDVGVRGTATASFNGHSSMDDPFGFDVFGPGSAGNKHVTKTETTYTSSANADSFFDDFDPLANFAETSDGHEVNQAQQVVTITTTTTSPSRELGWDQLDPFRGFPANGSDDVTQEASFKSTHSWADDDFRTPKIHDARDDLGHNFSEELTWKTEEIEDKGFNQNQFHHSDQAEEPSEEVRSSDVATSDYLDHSRGRISLEEIQQRTYEDVSPVSSGSYSQNRKETKPVEKSSSAVYVLGAAADNICKVCAKRVYEMEKVTADLQVYHKSCFRCYHCNRILSLGNFAANDGRLYCKPHFIEIFKTKKKKVPTATLR